MTARSCKINHPCAALLGLAFALAVFTSPAPAQPLQEDFSRLDQTHDLVSAPAWGPYSKKYAGISHVPDLAGGLRFDFTVLPGFYRFKTLVPNVLFASDYYPWDANPSLTRLTYRYELEWKDRVYVDVTYSLLDAHSVLVAMHCVNRAALPQNLALNLMASVDFPREYPAVRAEFPPATAWINAVHYETLTRAHPRADDGLVFNGWMRCEARGTDYLDGCAVAAGFGADAGDKVTYDLGSNAPADGVISLRYRLTDQSRQTFQLSGISNEKLTLTGTGKFELVQVPFSATAGPDRRLTLVSAGGSGIELNGFFIGPQADADGIRIQPAARQFTPEVQTPGTNTLILKYADIADCYGIAWNFSPAVVRQFLNDDLDVFFRKSLQDHVDTVLTGNKLGHYENAYLRPVEIPAGGERTVCALLCNGSQADVRQETAAFVTDASGFIAREPRPDDPFATILPAGQPYVFSQKMMRAALLANLVYPVYTQKQYIRHFSPGKWWDSLYTWDEGFLALGLETINPDFAAECLNTYTTPADSQSAFIAHGSLVPTQVFAFFDLWNRTQSPELLRYFYPRLKRYYDFLAGKTGGSTTRALPSNLLRTWDYFYNSGGWDDYPPQVAVHKHHQEKSVTPVVTTAQCIRFAKILRLAAQSLGLDADVQAYDHDIELFSTALQTDAWDAQSGYFSYVVHNAGGQPTNFLRTADGQNYNMGLDGAYPLVSGICTPQQQAILLAKIFSPTNLWTPSGIGAVDQSASYYRNDGYWNGTVWMPHQWFLWKTMLDLGRPDLAWTIAHKALDVWKTETDESYGVFEHFLADSGRGAGWHQFTSLSAPVLNWFAAYFQPGTVTAGFEILLKQSAFDVSRSRFEAALAFDQATAPHSRSLLVCLNPDHEYQAVFNGQKVEITSPLRGVLQLILPATNDGGKLTVTATGQ